MANNNVVVQAILGVTQNPQIQAAMLLGSRMESSWSPSAVGDNGTSFGPFQIHLPAHPGVSQAQAEDPVWAAHYMLPAYTAGVAAVPAALWGTNPALAAATAAYHAERPAKMYTAYNADWTYVEQALGGTSVATGGSTNGASPGTGASTASATSSITTSFNVAGNNAYMGGLILLGIALAVGGLIFLVKGELALPKIVAPKISVELKEPVRKKANNANDSEDDSGDGTAVRANTRKSTSRRSTASPLRGTVVDSARQTAGRKQPTVINLPARRAA